MSKKLNTLGVRHLVPEKERDASTLLGPTTLLGPAQDPDESSPGRVNILSPPSRPTNALSQQLSGTPCSRFRVSQSVGCNALCAGSAPGPRTRDWPLAVGGDYAGVLHMWHAVASKTEHGRTEFRRTPLGLGFRV